MNQRCVWAPTLFSIFLSVTLVEAYGGLNDGVFIQSCLDADLVNVSHFKARTKTTQILVRELLYAYDSALVAHTPEHMHCIVDIFSAASKKFGLQINIKKTEAVNKIDDFTYLGSIILKDGALTRS